MKKKNIILVLLIFIILIVITFGTLYFYTDVFKTNKQVFFENLSKIKNIDKSLLLKYRVPFETIENSNYSSEINLDFAQSVANSQTAISEVKNIFTFKNNNLVNRELKQAYNDYTFGMNNKDIVTLKTIRDDNTYGIIMNDVVTKYLALENKNLKEFFTKLGIEDTTKIPDSIEIDKNEIFEINNEKLQNTLNKYYTLLYESINKENFEKKVNEDKTQNLILNLTEKEINALYKKVLQTVKEDQVILNFIVNKASSTGNDSITISDIQNQIQEILDDYIQKEDDEQGGVIRIILLKNKEKVLKLILQVEYKDNDDANKKYKIEFDVSKNKEYTISIFENDIELIKIIITYNYDENNINTDITFENKTDKIDMDSIRIQCQLTDYQTEKIKVNSIIYVYGIQEYNYQVSFSGEFNVKQDIQIDKLTTENSVILNDVSKENLYKLYTAIGERINSVYGKQLENVLPSSSIIEKAKSSNEEYKKAQQEEQAMLEKYQQQLENKINIK